MHLLPHHISCLPQHGPQKSRSNVPFLAENSILYYHFTLSFTSDDDGAAVKRSCHGASLVEMHRVGAAGQSLPHCYVLRVRAMRHRFHQSHGMVSILGNAADDAADVKKSYGAPTKFAMKLQNGLNRTGLEGCSLRDDYADMAESFFAGPPAESEVFHDR